MKYNVRRELGSKGEKEMTKKFIAELNKIINSNYKESSPTDEIYLQIVKQSILKYSNTKVDDYNKLIKKSLNNVSKHSELNVSNKLNHLIEKIDPLFLCAISDQYIGSKKREFTGSYYTPVYIIEYMIYDGLKNYILQNTPLEEDEVITFLRNRRIIGIDKIKLQGLLDMLNKIKIIDISCGTGLFLLYAFDIIYKLKITILNQLKIKFSYYHEKKFMLENTIFGIDVQSIPLEIFTLTCMEILARHDEFNIEECRLNIFQENSILGKRIFDIKPIKEIVDGGGFDIVIGNPPYIGEKGNKSKFAEIKDYDFGKRYYEGKMDYFYYFIYRGVNLLKKKGVLSFITTNYFVTADGASKLRRFLKNNTTFKSIINFNECEIFKSAKGQHNLIFTLLKGHYNSENISIKYFNKSNYNFEEIKNSLFRNKKSNENVSFYNLDNQNLIYGNNGNILIFSNESYTTIINKIITISETNLGEICNINQGIVSGGDKVSKRMLETKLSKGKVNEYNIKEHEGVFVLDKEELEDSYLSKCTLLKPFYKNSDIKKYYTKIEPEKYILYFTDNNIIDNSLCKAINNHLYKFREALSLRRETQKGTRKWYALQWSRDETIFEGSKIVVPHRALLNNFGYNENMWYASADVYFITKKSQGIDLKLLLGLLNSKLIYFWLYNMGKRKGNYLELYSRPLREIPIKMNFNSKAKKKIIGAIDKIIDRCRISYDPSFIDYYQSIIDSEIYGIYGLSEEEISLIENLYMIRNR